MIASFANVATEDIFDGRNSADARRLLPRDLWKIAFRKLDQINVATALNDLRVPPGNRLEALRVDRKGSTAFESTINIEFVFFGPRAEQKM